MKKYFLLVVLLISATSLSSQRARGQLIAYIDMEYILENIPEYIQAQNTLNSKVSKWKNKLDKQARHIEVLKSDLANEKAILTKDLIEEKEEEITIKQEEFRRLESLYFGPKGDLFAVRKQLVKPIQDQVYNAVQSIVKRKKYDFVFEKSSDLIMLYSNKKYDISELVLSTIDRTRLSNKKKEKRNKSKNTSQNKELTIAQKNIIAKKEQATLKKETAIQLKKDAIAKKIADKEAKKKEIDESKKTIQKNDTANTLKKEAAAKKIADKEAKKKAIANKRKALLKQRDEKRKLLKEKKDALKKKKEEAKKKKEKKEKNI